MCVCVYHVCVYVCMQVCVHTYVHIYIYVHLCLCIQVNIRLCIYIHMCVYIYMYAYCVRCTVLGSYTVYAELTLVLLVACRGVLLGEGKACTKFMLAKCFNLRPVFELNSFLQSWRIARHLILPLIRDAGICIRRAVQFQFPRDSEATTQSRALVVLAPKKRSRIYRTSQVGPKVPTRWASCPLPQLWICDGSQDPLFCYDIVYYSIL